MKELSIEEKAKAYDEAFERARKINSGDGVPAPPDWTTCEVIFPQLRESEIRKRLIALVNAHGQGMYKDEMLAWLEKKDATHYLTGEDVEDVVKGALMGCAISFINYLNAHAFDSKMLCVSNREYEDIEDAFQNSRWDRLHRYYCKYIENQGEQKPVEPQQDMLSQEKYAKAVDECIYGEQKPAEWHKEDEQNLNVCLGYIPDEFLRRWLMDVMHAKYDKPAELPKGQDYGIDGLYAAIDILQKTLGEVEGYQTDDGILTHKCAISAVKQLSERKLVDADIKDIVDKEANSIWKEINTGGSHSIIDSFNQFYGICMQVAEAVVDYQKPAWSEEDEKMFRDLHNLIYVVPDCDCDSKEKLKLSDWLESFKGRNQSKQEREWGKEDEKCIRLSTDIIDSALRAGFCVQLDRDRCVDWFKSLKERVQPKQEWSGEDEVKDDWEYIQDFIKKLGHFPNDSDELNVLTNYVLNKKQKSLRPQSQWKPSEEQMKALNEAMYYVNDSVATQIAMLIGELNKL